MTAKKKKKIEHQENPVQHLISHWTTSSMLCFLRNPLIFKKRYVLYIDDNQSSVSAMIGKAGHHALKTYFGANDEVPMMGDKNDVNLSIQAGLDWLDQMGDHMINYGKTGSREKMLQTYIKAITWYFQGMPEYEIVSAEKKHQEHLLYPDGTEAAIPMKGYADLVIRNKKGEIEIIDHKFTSTYTDPNEESGKKIIQAMFLYHLVKGHTGETPKRIRYRECKTTKNDDGSPQTWEYGIEYDQVPHYFTFFYQIYNDCTKALCRPDVMFLPNIDDLYDGNNAYMIYQQGLLGVDMSDVVVDHNTQHIKYVPKMNKFLESTLDNVDSSGWLPEERVRVKLGEFGIPVKPEATHIGPSVILYRFTPSRGVAVKKIEQHAQDIAVALRAPSVRIIAPIPGTNSIGIEVPKGQDEREVIKWSIEHTTPNSWEIPIGMNLYGSMVHKDIRKMPHLLVAGATGSGKSVFINTILSTLTTQQSPENMQMVLIDPKRVELAQWAEDPHALTINNLPSVIHTPSDAIAALEWLVAEMEHRYKVLHKVKVRSIEKYAGRDLPYIIIVVDEFADLIMSREKLSYKNLVTGEMMTRVVVGSEIEQSIVRLAQMGRAAGIHLIVGTQHPTVNVITGVIKANLPTRVAFMTVARSDSRVILDQNGAEDLLGAGDMLFMNPSAKGLERLQGLFI